MSAVASAYSRETDSAAAAAELIRALSGTSDPRVVVYFAGISHDGGTLGGAFAQAFPEAQVIGCSTDGEFSSAGYGDGGVAAIALGAAKFGRTAATMVKLDDGVEAGVHAAASELSRQLGVELRDLDPQRWIGLALLEGAKGQEEKINEVLGDVAPFLSFVGGSAGDDIAYSRTWVSVGDQHHDNACALLVLEIPGPFAVIKSCNYRPTDIEVELTTVDPVNRLVHEIDGKPAASRYAEIIGVERDELEFSHFLANPIGLMIDDEPWLRSLIRREGESILLACRVLPGTRMKLMRGRDIVEETRTALDKAIDELGCEPAAGVFFNCCLRKIETQVNGVEDAYHEVLSRIPHAGLHTNGESWLGHINQTLVGLLLG